MSDTRIVVDASQFQDAINQYAMATRKGVAESINRAFKNWMFHARDLCAVARKESIRSLSKTPWWPKLIAKILSGGGNELKGLGLAASTTSRRRQRVLEGYVGYNASEIYQAQWAVKNSGRWQQRGKGVRQRWVASAQQREYAKRAQSVGEAIIRKRLHGVEFLRLWFVAAARRIETASGLSSGLGQRGVSVADRILKSFQIDFSPARDGRLNAALDESYVYVQRGKATARRAEGLLRNVIAASEAATVADIRKYAAEKMANAAAKHSAKKAA